MIQFIIFLGAISLSIYFPILFFYAAMIAILAHFNAKDVVFGVFSAIFFLLVKCPLGIALSVVFLIFFCLPFVRRYLLSNPLLLIIKKLGVLPKISDTEKTAIDAGTTWVEGEFFKVKPKVKKILKEPFFELSAEEKSFMEKEVEEVCNLVNDWDVFQNKDLPKEAWQYLKDKKFFGMIIPKKYGGLEFSPTAQSAIVGKLGTRSQVLSITTMVPNSLGPGELLMKYGTEKQKKYYLPRLANGLDIPCFGLTEVFAGSDAASIRSSGELFKDVDGSLKIKINFEKRYITLGGIATIIGLAFQLTDPKNLLPKGKKLGITCALLKGDLPGITRGKRHMPMHIPFINSPIWGKDVIISVEEDVIGGKNGLGEGWRMLMECLSIGRGISLPAISAAGSKFTTSVTLMYSSLRRQFGVPIIKFEAVEEVLARMIANTYTVEAVRVFTASAVQNGQKPAITNAIAKYHATEIARKVINDAMDVLGGSAISTGPNNLISQAYMGIPIGITVEGANIMTRSLLQFGQGLMRCHPFLYKEMISIMQGDLKEFDINLWGHIGAFFAKRIRWFTLYFKQVFVSILSLFIRQSVTYKYAIKMERLSCKFSFLADLVLLMYGGSFKIKERLSGRFADVLSNLYMMSATLAKFKANGLLKGEEPVLTYALEQCLQNIDKALAEIYENISTNYFVSFLIKFVFLLPKPAKEAMPTQDKITYKILKIASKDAKFRENLFTNIFVSKKQNDRFNMMHLAYSEIEKAEVILKKIKLARKTFEEALKENIITKDEHQFITKWNSIVEEIMQVDNFPLKSNAF